MRSRNVWVSGDCGVYFRRCSGKIFKVDEVMSPRKVAGNLFGGIAAISHLRFGARRALASLGRNQTWRNAHCDWPCAEIALRVASLDRSRSRNNDERDTRA
jgi:hypothetical protein